MSPIRQHFMPDLSNRRTPVTLPAALIILDRAGIESQQIQFLAVGSSGNYRGEIQEQDPAPGTEIYPSTIITLHVGFPSAVDILPYQFFYGLAGNVERTGEWEDNARSLMAPFDAAVMRAEAMAVLVPLAYNFSILSEHHLTRYLKLFDQRVVGESDLNALRVWAEAIPGFYQWGGNARFVERFLQSLFGYRFTVTENVPSRHHIPDSLRWRLGKKQTRLGQEAVLGASFEESDTTFEVTVHDVPPNDIAGFLPGHPERQKLEEVLAICMPAGMTAQIRVASLANEGRLAGENRHNRLGYTARLAKAKNDRQMRVKVS